MKSRSRILVAVLVAIAVVLAACGSAATPTTPPQATTQAPPKPTPIPPTATPAPPKVIKIALNGEPNTLDPAFSAGRVSQAFLCNIFDSLTAFNPTGGLEPALAESWKSLDDKTWQFNLRKGVFFHNGEPFNADSVKASLDRILDPDNKSPMLGRVGAIDHVDVVDEYTVNVVMKTPDVTLPVRLSELYGSMVPPKYLAEVGNDGFAKNPVGTGPYKFVSWVKNAELTLDANDDYWRGAPAVDRIIVYPITEDSSRMAALQTGEVDVAAAVPPFMVDQLNRSGNLSIVNVPSTRYYFIVMRTDKPPFNDRRVRQAVNYALDVPILIRSVSYGYGRQIATVAIPEAFGYDPTVAPYPYDVAKAKDLLAQAGYPNGLDVTFDSFTGSIVDHSKLAEAIVGQLAEVGIRCKLNVTESGVFSPIRLANQTNELYIYSFGEWAFDLDNTFGLLMQTKSGYYYADPDVLELYTKERGTFDRAQREKLLKDLQKAFYEDSPYGYLYQLDTIWGMQKGITYTPRVDELLWFYEIDRN